MLRSPHASVVAWWVPSWPSCCLASLLSASNDYSDRLSKPVYTVFRPLPVPSLLPAVAVRCPLPLPACPVYETISMSGLASPAPRTLPPPTAWLSHPMSNTPPHQDLAPSSCRPAYTGGRTHQDFETGILPDTEHLLSGVLGCARK